MTQTKNTLTSDFSKGSSCQKEGSAEIGGGTLILCASHEDRCLGVIRSLGCIRPRAAIIIHYTDDNPRREKNYRKIVRALRATGAEYFDFPSRKSDLLGSLIENRETLRKVLARFGHEIHFDISVLLKKHLFLLLNWVFDSRLESGLHIYYTEPLRYLVSEHIPLSFGVKSVELVPGYQASAVMSRPQHLILFLGSEGERAKAVFDYIQPMRTTLFVIDPPTLADLNGITARYNRELIETCGETAVRKISALSPLEVMRAIRDLRNEDGKEFSPYSGVICALGTKAQSVGVFLYLRRFEDAPALLYASPLRHNQQHYSDGIGRTHKIFSPGDALLD